MKENQVCNEMDKQVILMELIHTLQFISYFVV